MRPDRIIIKDKQRDKYLIFNFQSRLLENILLPHVKKKKRTHTQHSEKFHF